MEKKDEVLDLESVGENNQKLNWNPITRLLDLIMSTYNVIATV
jgi:hypothetical protein